MEISSHVKLHFKDSTQFWRIDIANRKYQQHGWFTWTSDYLYNIENAWEAKTNAKVLSLQGLCFVFPEQHIQGTHESLTSGFLLVSREHVRTFQIQCDSTLLVF